ncbi:MAG: hypothetical protein V3U80_03425 [Flavobacteriaceae bacterium]
MKTDFLVAKNETSTVKKKGSINKLNGEFSFLTDYKSKELLSSEVIIHPAIQTLSRVSTNGKIKFCNSEFIKTSGLTKKNAYNKSIHPMMPKTIFNYVVKNLELKKEVIAIVKQIDKSGNLFWMNVHFIPNKTDNYSLAFTTKSNPTSQKVIKQISKIYNTVFLLEKHVDKTIALNYFEGLLEMEYGNYEGFLINFFE